MKQVFQSLSTGETQLVDLPVPSFDSNQLLVRTTCSLVSAGTERMLVEFGKANLIEKVRQQPDKFAEVLNKAKTDGLPSTLSAVQDKLGEAIPVGYSNVGIVSAIGDNVTGFKIGDRVVSNSPHSEFVVTYPHLCSLIPANVSDESAAFTVLGSIGLQGIRLIQPTLGETFLVSGLGLIGILTAQLLAAHGCRVLGVDPDPLKCDLAERLSIKCLNLSTGIDPVAWCLQQTEGIGVDGAVITAATSSSEPIHVAARACRQRGRIVLVGVTGLDLRRDLFYKKELSFQVSCSYGPGRYDPSYEQKGHDYPIGFVRWTEQRNFTAVLHALSVGSLSTDSLITHRFPLENVGASYELLSRPDSSLGILLQYSGISDSSQRTIALNSDPFVELSATSNKPQLSIIGTGNYARRILIPSFAQAGANFYSIISSSGSGTVQLGRKFGFSQASTDLSSLLGERSCNAVVIATRHDSHARLVGDFLSAGKHVFVEKPLCLSSDELCSVEKAFTGKHLLMVGFNRRFAPLVKPLKDELAKYTSPKAFVYYCNAGNIPEEHWIQDPQVGGGRLLGEACHFVDLLRFLASSPIEDLRLVSAADRKPCPDTFSLQIRFEDGSIGTVHYFSNGSKSFPKERLEVFVDGRVLQLDNYRKLKAWGIPGFRTRRSSQDKGQVACCAAFLKAIEIGGAPPIPMDEIFEVQRWLLEVIDQ